MQMTGTKMAGKTSYTADQIAGDWTTYKIRQPHPLLAPGSVIALHNPTHNRFLATSSNDMTVTKVKGKNNFPDSWSYAKFRVVDAGFGMIALYSEKEQSFVRLHGKDLKLSGKRADGTLPAKLNLKPAQC